MKTFRMSQQWPHPCDSLTSELESSHMRDESAFSNDLECKKLPEASRDKSTGYAEACPVRGEAFRREGGGFAFHTLAGGLRTSSLPGELLEAVNTEAMAALSLDRLPQDLETLLTFVFILHGH